MIQSCRKLMLCAICLAVALTQVVLAQDENLPYVAHDSRQAQANIIGSSVAVNFQSSVGYGNSEGGIIEIGLMAQKRKQEVADVKQNAIDEVKQDAIYIPVAERNTTDEAVKQNAIDEVKQDAIYIPVAERNTTDEAVKQIKTYNPVAVQSINYGIAKKAAEEISANTISANTEEINNAVATQKVLVELYPEKAINKVSQEKTRKHFEDLNDFNTLKY